MYIRICVYIHAYIDVYSYSFNQFRRWSSLVWRRVKSSVFWAFGQCGRSSCSVSLGCTGSWHGDTGCYASSFREGPDT